MRRQVNGTCVNGERRARGTERKGMKSARECATRKRRGRRGLEGEGNSEKRGKPVEISRWTEGRGEKQIGTRGKFARTFASSRLVAGGCEEPVTKGERESNRSSWESFFFFFLRKYPIFRTPTNFFN